MCTSCTHEDGSRFMNSIVEQDHFGIRSELPENVCPARWQRVGAISLPSLATSVE